MSGNMRDIIAVISDPRVMYLLLPWVLHLATLVLIGLALIYWPHGLVWLVPWSLFLALRSLRSHYNVRAAGGMIPYFRLYALRRKIQKSRYGRAGLLPP